MNRLGKPYKILSKPKKTVKIKVKLQQVNKKPLLESGFFQRRFLIVH